MRVSIATYRDRVCPRFDRAATLIVLDVRKGRQEECEILDISGWPAHGRAARVAELGIDQLICGALSSFDEAGFEESPVRLTCQVSGPVNAVIQAIVTGAIAPGQDYWPNRTEVRAPERQGCHEARKAELATRRQRTKNKRQDDSDSQRG